MIFRRTRAGAVVIRGDHLLVIGQDDTSGTPYRWNHLPGGGIEEGESPEQAAVRVTGPEIHELGPELAFAAECVPIADLPRLALWPRAAFEAVAVAVAHDSHEPLPLVDCEDERMAWMGTPFRPAPRRQRACIVLVHDGRLAVIHRRRPETAPYATLPGGGVEADESPFDAARREAIEELGIEVTPLATLAVVQVQPQGSLQHFVWCEAAELVGFGHGTGDEFTPARQAERGTYDPAWVPISGLRNVGLRPDWLTEFLPRWIADPQPDRPDRFFEVASDKY